MTARSGGDPGLPAVDLRTRARDLRELMDEPDCDPRTLDRTFRRFALVNALISGWRAAWRSHVAPALPVTGRGRVLDLGCGGGDLARSLVRWAAADGFELEVVGADPDERAIAAARRSTPAGVTFRQQSSAELVVAGERFDVVVSNHVLHHLGDEERDGFLADSAVLAGTRSLHSDIRRSPAAYRAYALASPLVAAGTFVRVDGLRSIRRSYTVPELQQVLPQGWRAEAAAPHRVLAIRDA
ncbi:methyltransferase domain-containing protein [Curtobacterium oceanosedimentum]|uniref:methyltransferase domain-containing protein n=1 Tax=Curtobacterium oceanosedimentum TaxID=465820 RepID=UPI001CE0B8EC|nr:methyltransferase domain-containing protein [Curtobacterium oceanosedimentum]MCA5922267.1 methyltransferase domain-containing protein [Curtobacterium oceanosedimentum]